MTFKEFVMFFEFHITNASKVIGVSRETIYRWKRKDKIPMQAQMRIESATNGALKSDYFLVERV